MLCCPALHVFPYQLQGALAEGPCLATLFLSAQWLCLGNHCQLSFCLYGMPCSHPSTTSIIPCSLSLFWGARRHCSILLARKAQQLISGGDGLHRSSARGYNIPSGAWTLNCASFTSKINPYSYLQRHGDLASTQHPSPGKVWRGQAPQGLSSMETECREASASSSTGEGHLEW